MTIADILQIITSATSRQQKIVLGHVNLHAAYVNKFSILMQAFYSYANYVYVDGMAIIWWMRILGYPARKQHRNTLIDWLDNLLEMACAYDWHIYHLGGTPAVAEAFASHCKTRYPGLKLSIRDGYFDAANTAQNAAVITEIRLARPNILLVGMGMPRQEIWILQNIEEIQANVIIACGGTANYIVGAIPTPSRRLSLLGLEWFCRLLAEPRRLWRRYLVEPWALASLCAHDVRLKIGRK